MKTHVTLQWIKQRFFHLDSEPGVDPFIASVDLVELTPDIIYATGMVSQKGSKITRAEYAQGFSQLGSQEMLYFRPDGNPIFGGQKVYVKREGEFEQLEGLFLKQLTKS